MSLPSKFTSLIILSSLLLSCHGPTTPIVPPNAWIHLTSPNGGETWFSGESYTITWESNEITGAVNLDWSPNGFDHDSYTIASNENNDGSFVWSDIDIENSFAITIKITSSSYPSISDISDTPISLVHGAGWVRTFGGPAYDHTWDIVFGPDESIYAGGSSWIGDSFCATLAKTDLVGSTQWEKGWGLESTECCTYGIDADLYGYIYACGKFRAFADFYPGPGEWFLTSNGDIDGFLSKFDTSGTLLWSCKIGGPLADEIIAVHELGGNLYLTGRFQGTVDFDPGPGIFELTAEDDFDGFLVKLDSDADFIWARRFGGISMDGGYDVTSGPDGSILVCGAINHMASLIGFTESGSEIVQTAWGDPQYDNQSYAVASSSSDIYVTGIIRGPCDLNPGTGADWQAINEVGHAFLSKFDGVGNYLWGKVWGSDEGAIGVGLGIDFSGDVYVTGYYRGLNVDLDPEAGTSVFSSNGLEDACLSKFTPDGDLIWARSWGGEGYDVTEDVIIDGSGCPFIAGQFMYTVDFSNGMPCAESPDESSSTGQKNLFLMKLLPSGCRYE